MAELAYKSTRQVNGAHNVVRSTGSAVLGGAEVAVIVDNADTKPNVRAALEAALRAVSRDEQDASSPAAYPTTTTSVE